MTEKFSLSRCCRSGWRFHMQDAATANIGTRWKNAKKKRKNKDRLSRRGNDTLYANRKNASWVHVARAEKTVENLLPHRCTSFKSISWRARCTRSTALTVTSAASNVVVQHYYPIRSFYISSSLSLAFSIYFPYFSVLFSIRWACAEVLELLSNR